MTRQSCKTTIRRSWLTRPTAYLDTSPDTQHAQRPIIDISHTPTTSKFRAEQTTIRTLYLFVWVFPFHFSIIDTLFIPPHVPPFLYTVCLNSSSMSLCFSGSCIFSPLETISTSLWAVFTIVFQYCLFSVMSSVSSYFVHIVPGVVSISPPRSPPSSTPRYNHVHHLS